MGRCDFAVFPEDVIDQEVTYGHLSKTGVIATYGLRFRLSKKNESLVPSFNAIINSMVNSGEIEEIMNKYLEDAHASSN